MKLYYSPGACSLAPHLILEELEITYETEAVDLKNKTMASGSYLQINPKGTVPALMLDNGEMLTEVAVLLQYLGDQKPEFNLIPKAGQMERYRCQEWLNYIATEMHKGFGPLFSVDRWPSSPEIKDEVKTRTKEALGRKFDYLSSQLQKNSFLMKEKFTVADAYLFVILTWTNFLKIDLAPWTVLTQYRERIQSRPATQRALQAEGLLK